MNQLLTFFTEVAAAVNVQTYTPDTSSCQEYQDLEELSIVSLNKKNVIRNLIRAFLQYIFGKNQKNSILQQYFPNLNEYDAKQQVKRYFAKKKYNHLVLKQLYRHSIYGQMFKNFLLNESNNYLERSQIKEKDNHQSFISFLIRCYEDESLLDKLETYSKIKKI